MLRHPGHAKVTTSRPGEEVGGPYEIWISDGEIVRTYVAAHKLGTQRPIRNRPRGLDDPDFPGMSRIYEPVTPLPDGDAARHVRAPGGLLPERAGDRPLQDHRRAPRPPVERRSASAATTRGPSSSRPTGPTTAIEIAVDRDTGVIVRLIETIGGAVTRDAVVTVLEPDAPLPPIGLRVRLPDRDDDAVLEPSTARSPQAGPSSSRPHRRV